MNNEPAALTVDESDPYPVRLEQRWPSIPGAEPERIERIAARSVRDYDRREVAQLETSITRLHDGRVSYRAGSILLDDEAVYALSAELLGVDADLLRDFVKETNRDD